MKRLNNLILGAMSFFAVLALSWGVSVSAEGGCPPNDDCPEHYYPISIPCTLEYCDGDHTESGYCVLCMKIE